MDERDPGALRALVEPLRARDPDAWEELYRLTYRPLYGYARRRLSSDQAADDAVSEAMLRALGAIDRFMWRGGGLRAWLFGILRNVVLESHRSNPSTVPMEAVPEPPSNHPGPDDLAILDEEYRELREAFVLLDRNDREILELRVVARMTADEVARLLGKKPGAIRMAQSRALVRLRTALQKVSHGE